MRTTIILILSFLNVNYIYSQTFVNNLVVNGDFSGGNTGFFSGYQYASYNTVEGEYFISANPVNWNPGAATCTDHSSGSGKMMLVMVPQQKVL